MPAYFDVQFARQKRYAFLLAINPSHATIRNEEAPHEVQLAGAGPQVHSARRSTVNITVLPSPTATRNTDEISSAALARLTDNDIGPFDKIDDLLIANLLPVLGDRFVGGVK